MSQTLGEALPAAIATVSEWLGRQEVQADEHDALIPGMGDVTRMMAGIVRVKRDMAIAAQQSGDVIAMIAAYNELKPCLDLAALEPETE